MQKHGAARAAKVMIFVVLALFATACGGSDDAAETASNDDLVETTSETDRADAADEAGDADSGSSDDASTPPDPVVFEPTVTRDCAHSTAELGNDIAAEEEADDDVELPPSVKPEVGEELFGSFDELIVTDLIVGTGREAVPGATVGMQYVGVLATDGTEFDSSWDRGAQPFVFDLGAGNVINGWDVGIAGMRVGGRRILQIPAAQAYGDQDRSEIIVANSDLIFIVDMVDVSPPPEPAPPVPGDTLGSFGSLEIIDLVEGEGCTAEIGDIVQVHYVGVDAVDGIEFDSSWSRGDTFSIVVGRAPVIDGWNEGIAGMKVGGERILQIPAAQAYNDGDLVFRVHLEELVEAPFAHTVTFEGDAPDDIEITTLREGTGEGAKSGDVLDANIAIVLHNSNELVQSTWGDGQPAQLALQEGALLPGLEEGIFGIKVGEVRQISLPPEIAYPNGIPAGSGIQEDDALVFIVEPVRITAG